ncbi:Hsp20/alpha crystallin family protein [Tepidibacillus fermentans]|uniref:Hsp20/alpha crystallin family protein n=1 Tax=Tepidibacillus fermentans TaxID=1281767 RepID=A0A4V2UT30_9BACI|nr:Hsp20/alpha crystallin family protein [Tepidibacillus fermentans]TCS84009.1 Hsp20/alpha crystallin family protein [Tepidibacillus fermentans]
MSELERFFRDIENYFLNQVNQLFHGYSSWYPALPTGSEINEKIEEKDDKILVYIDLPDLSKDHKVHLSVNRDHLVMEGRLSKEENVHSNSGKSVTRSYSEYFYKTIPIPARVTAKGAKATYHRGILKVSLNKVGQFEDGTIHINFKA